MLQAVNNKILPFTVSKTQTVESRTVSTELIINNDLKLNEEILQRIVDAAKTGEKVGIVCNLVDDAQHHTKGVIKSEVNNQAAIFASLSQ